MLSPQKYAASLLALLTLAVLCSGPSESLAQRGGPGSLMGNSSLALLNDSKVLEELELDAEQVESLNDLQKDMRMVFRDVFGGMRDRFRDPSADRNALMSEIRETVQEKMKGVDDKLGDVLLPHQMSRLSELTFQNTARSGGTEGLLQNEKVREKLGLTEEQLEKIKEKAEEVKGKLDEKIKQAREDAQQEILSVLSSEQRAMITEMLGDSFEFEERRQFGRRGERGERGQRGERGDGQRGQQGGGGGNRSKRPEPSGD